MPEHQPHQPEHARHPEQTAAELEAIAREHRERLGHHTEHAPEADFADRRAEAARETIHKTEAAPEPQAQGPETEAAPAHHPVVTRLLNPKLNYAHTLASLQRRLPPASQAFSRVIHTPAVEKVSEALESTVARPSVTAGATWTALIIGSLFYLTARRYGYALSGSEIDLSFIIGAVLGIGIEWLWRTFIRRPR